MNQFRHQDKWPHKVPVYGISRRLKDEVIEIELTDWRGFEERMLLKETPEGYWISDPKDDSFEPVLRKDYIEACVFVDDYVMTHKV